MASTSSRLRSTVVNLLLACLNATLILVLACLVMLYLLVQRFDGVAVNIAQSLQPLVPVREDIATLNDNLGDLHQALRDLQSGDASQRALAAPALQARLDGLEQELSRINATIAGLLEQPTDLIDHAVARTAEAVIAGVRDIRGCTREGAESENT